MPETKLVSPLLDGFVMGESMSSHDGVSCYPAMKEDDKYIVKIISVPASQKQLDALLLTGAYQDAAAATAYFKELADGIVKEAETLQQLSKLEGFLPYDRWQVVPMEGGKLGYEVYLYSPYKRSLEKFLRNNPMTHLGAVNLGLDLCAALAVCRRAGYVFVDLKPANIYLTGEREFRISDLGFVELSSLKYAPMPNKYRSVYTAPELHDALATLNPTVDTYAVGMILYQIYNNGQLPFQTKAPAETLAAPLNADYEMAEIIMKAINPDPRVRWQNPIDMGQALVGYMQRNIVNDVPIVPPAAHPTAVIQPEETPVPEETTPIDDETLPGTEQEDVLEESPVRDEISSMLAQADELIAEPVSEPEEPQPEEVQPDPLSEEDDEEDEPFDDYPQDFAPPKKRGWIGLVAAGLILALLGCGGIYYYKNYYLIEIDGMKIDGAQDTVTVQLETDVDESLLYVVCTDTYGNTIYQKVTNGVAVFTALNPSTSYKITVEVEGFHGVIGSCTGSYTTQEQTKITAFTAKTGAEDGSVVLDFTVDGRETHDWVIRYHCEGEEDQTISLSGHNATINGLTVGRTYTFTLEAPEGLDLYITGENSIQFTASRIVIPENLQIVSCVDGVLTAQWKAPTDIAVNSWTVRCYSNDGFDETIVVTEPTAQFSGIEKETAYTVEVTAEGMAQGSRAYVTANPLEITDVQITESDGALNVSWNCSSDIPDGGWLLMYNLSGSDHQDVIACSENEGTISNIVPGSTYSISVQASNSSTVFGGTGEYTATAATDFEGYSLKADDIEASLCLVPEKENWTHKDLTTESYTTSFTADQKAALVLYSTSKIQYSKDEVSVLYVLRSETGKVLGQLVQKQSVVWNDLWSNDRYAYLTIPTLPTDPGSYSVEIYFDGALVTTKNLTITA